MVLDSGLIAELVQSLHPDNGVGVIGHLVMSMLGRGQLMPSQHGQHPHCALRGKFLRMVWLMQRAMSTESQSPLT